MIWLKRPVRERTGVINLKNFQSANFSPGAGSKRAKSAF
jgi:hypothetical protein